jgi:hypothetical protein
MLAEEQLHGRTPSLHAPLSDREASSLFEKYGARLFQGDSLLAAPGPAPSAAAASAAPNASRAFSAAAGVASEEEVVPRGEGGGRGDLGATAEIGSQVRATPLAKN